MNLNRKLLKYLIIISPLICGTIGFVILENEAFLDALFKCVTMYVLNYSDTPPNIFVEIARWTAPLVSAYSVFLIASTLQTKIRNYFRSRSADAVAVYGPIEYSVPLLTALGKSGVQGENNPVRTTHHILLWDETENFRFYDQHKESLVGKSVYLKCRSFPTQAAAGANLHIFCPEETAARVFWKENFLYETSCRCNHQMQIIMIGFGKLGSELLTYALQNNIFSPNQRIEYHIFGDDPTYLKIHHTLNNMQDPIIFHEDPWQKNLEFLENAERIIVLQQDEQMELLADLLLTLKARRIDVFSTNEAGLNILGGKERIFSFPWREIAYRPENILTERLYRRAKAINLRYAHLYSDVPETEENLNAEWEKLDTFTRYSNISSADYHEIRMKIIEAMGESDDSEMISPEYMEFLAELEHIRWCRYHWLNNWTYGVPEKGKSKDAVMRIHLDLIPYDQLTESEKQKDRDTVKLLLEFEKSEASVR